MPGGYNADTSATGGALSGQRIMLIPPGATHHHKGPSELFHVLGGAAEIFTGESIVTAQQGDLIVIPPSTVHAFAAAPSGDADLLIIITLTLTASSTSATWSASPRAKPRSRASSRSRSSTGQVTEHAGFTMSDVALSLVYDNHFDESPAWQQALLSRLLSMCDIHPCDARWRSRLR